MHKSLRFISGSLLFALALCLPPAAGAYETTAKQAVLMDVSSDTVLFEKDARSRLYPASMSKLMTVYLVFDRLKQGALSLQDKFMVSEKAWRMQGSKMFVELGNAIAVEDLLRGIIVQSGNDACVVVAEGLAGSEEAFADMMNAKAHDIGLEGSHFINSTGWPDENHYMTAYDLMLLSRRLIEDFPEYYHYFSEEEFVYHGIRQPNRNTLLDKSLGVDGLKTGHTEEAGYGISSSAIDKNGRRLIAVVHGTGSMHERIQEAEKLLRYGFLSFKPVTLFQANQEIASVPVWFGREPSVPVTVAAPLPLSLPAAGSGKELSLKLVYNQPAPAPVRQGDHIADLEVSAPGKEPFSIPLHAAQDVAKLGTLERILPTLEYYMFGAAH